MQLVKNQILFKDQTHHENFSYPEYTIFQKALEKNGLLYEFFDYINIYHDNCYIVNRPCIKNEHLILEEIKHIFCLKIERFKALKKKLLKLKNQDTTNVSNPDTTNTVKINKRKRMKSIGKYSKGCSDNKSTEVNKK